MPPLPTQADRAGALVYDWNSIEASAGAPRHGAVVDETLRDGLQNPSVADPTIGEKLAILHQMEELRFEGANVGIPGSSKRAFEHALRLCREAANSRMKIALSTAGRTLAADILPMIELSQQTGIALEACVFIGSSPIRQAIEAWDVGILAKRSADAIDLARKAGLRVSFVTEDTTRSRPEVLEVLFRAAIDHGASRLVLSDTVGHATREGVRNLIRFAEGVIASSGASVGIDWHGHNDRGLALSNALCALQSGAGRVHGTALGIGERVGNAPIELILVNLHLAGQLAPSRPLHKLVDYCESVARAVGWTIPPNYPVVGRDAFRTASGVHASAIAKALQQGDPWLADRVYSSVSATTFGRHQEVEVGFMSGASNVAHWLRQRHIEPSAEIVALVLKAAKATTRLLTDDEIMAIVVSHGSAPQAAAAP